MPLYRSTGCHDQPTRDRLWWSFALLWALLIYADSSGLAAGTAASFDPAGSGPLYPDHANGKATAVPSLEAFSLGEMTIELDGVLDDEAWNHAQTGFGFQENDPNRFAPASVPSTFKIAYDEDAIYFAVACWEDDMSNVSSYLSRRDDITASDFISIYIDPYHDQTTGYNFRVTAEGVQQDAYLFDNGSRDWDWNAVWICEVSRDSRGWYAEVRVPFSAIRFKPEEDMTWGLQMYRWLHGRGEDTGWVTWERNLSGFVSRWGTLTGLRGVSNPRKLEVLPYLLTKHVDPAAEGAVDVWENTQNFGADFKYGITSNLTLNATFQPDFGQVEADPALLNLSPFETFYEEKRPFFVEGARFFQHPHFNLFYSRRIGTGHPNSRIRGAAKLTGKVAGSFSIAALAAATDLAAPGTLHNPFEVGEERAYYGLLRAGQQFNEGNHQINVMGTAVKRDPSTFATASPRFQRDAVTGGADFEMNFRDRTYRIAGSVVGTAVQPFSDRFDSTVNTETLYGTGGLLDLQKAGGKWRGILRGTWESNKLDPNDMGFLSAPDEKTSYGQVSYHYNADGSGSRFQTLDVELEAHKSWLYAGNAGYDINTGVESWSYDKNHRQRSGVHFFTWAQDQNFNQAWIFVGNAFEGTDKYVTRGYADQRGPLMTVPPWYNAAGSLTSDWRKPLSVEAELSFDWGEYVTGRSGEIGLRWNQSEHFTHRISFGMRHDDVNAQWIYNDANDGSMAGVVGIGGVDYVFGALDQKTWDLTLRSSVLFDRNKSLQLYLQPFLTQGDFSDPKWLATPDSYDLRPYDIEVSTYDFNYGALNLNLVFRWEYRPGSTIYVVWTHTKQQYEERGMPFNRQNFKEGFDAGFPFRSEPGNTFLVKISYWFSI